MYQSLIHIMHNYFRIYRLFHTTRNNVRHLHNNNNNNNNNVNSIYNIFYYMGFNFCSSVSVSARVREDTDIVNGFITRV